ATCYPGFEKALSEAGAIHTAERVVRDGNIITSNGPSSAIQFGLALVEALCGADTAKTVASGILL
ncbi:DJ-1/PfpI family protein, partial [uncultured Duncaniella sp.]